MYAQMEEQRGDLAAGVLVDALQAHEGIEHEQARLERSDGGVKTVAVGRKIPELLSNVADGRDQAAA